VPSTAEPQLTAIAPEQLSFTGAVGGGMRTKLPLAHPFVS
jgi:hypothetical protein